MPPEISISRKSEGAPGGPECRFWLGRMTAIEGAVHGVALLDGCHDGPDGVAAAAKLYGRIFNDHGPFVMVRVEPLPDLDPPINEQAAGDCARLLAGEFKR